MNNKFLIRKNAKEDSFQINTAAAVLEIILFLMINCVEKDKEYKDVVTHVPSQVVDGHTKDPRSDNTIHRWSKSYCWLLTNWLSACAMLLTKKFLNLVIFLQCDAKRRPMSVGETRILLPWNFDIIFMTIDVFW